MKSALNFLLAALNDAAGRILNLDPDGKRRLAELRGKVFCLDIVAPPITLYALPTESGLEFCRADELPPDAAPDVTLRGTLFAFAQFASRELRAHSPGDAARNAQIEIQGNAELMQALQSILMQLDLDWEELLAMNIGDGAARKVNRAMRAAAQCGGETFALARENLADYVVEEKRVIADESALQVFTAEVDRARADVDRVTRRVARLESLTSPDSSSNSSASNSSPSNSSAPNSSPPNLSS